MLLNLKPLIILCLIGVVISGCGSTRKYKDISARKKKERKTAYAKRSANTSKKTYRPATSASRSKAKSYKSNTASTSRHKLVRSAMTHLGVSYVYGGKSPSGFDCSGLTSYVFRQHGISLQGSTRDQVKLGKPKSLNEAEAGDLIFFKNKGRIVHVSIVAENSEDELWVVHSTSSRGVVKDEILHSPYWRPKVAEVRGILD